MIVQVPVGNAVVLRQQDTVQRPRRGDLVVPGLRGQQFVQQDIDHGVGDTRVVLAAVDRGLTGVEILPLLQTGAQGLLQGHQNHVEIETVQTLLVLSAVDGAQPCIDPQAAQVFDVGLQNAFKVGVDQQDLEAQRLLVGIEQTLVRQRPASLGKQLQGLAQGFARYPAAIGFRWSEWLGEQAGGQLIAVGRQEQPFGPGRQTRRGKFAVGVVAGRAVIGVAEQRAVGPFEIEQQPQGLAHADVGEGGAPGVHEQALGLGWYAVRNLCFDHLTAGDCGEVIAIGPVLGLMLDVDVEFTRLERFERHVAVAVELDLDPIEIVFAAVDRQVLAPVILDPFEHQLSTRLHAGDAVGATAQRRFEGGRFEVPVFPVMLRQHRQFAQAQNQQRIARAFEDKADAMTVENVDALHFLQGGAVLRVTVLKQCPVGKRHVVGGDRLAVMEARLRTQVEHHPTAVLAVFN